MKKVLLITAIVFLGAGVSRAQVSRADFDIPETEGVDEQPRKRPGLLHRPETSTEQLLALSLEDLTRRADELEALLQR